MCAIANFTKIRQRHLKFKFLCYKYSFIREINLFLLILNCIYRKFKVMYFNVLVGL